jgi:P pilus assembly chaperone PapD
VQVKSFFRAVASSAALYACVVAEPAQAEIILSQLIVDLQPGHHDREDVEVLNTGPDRAFVAVKPKEVLRSGTPAETRVGNPDPAKLGLLVAPARLILEPGQRKLIRISSIGAADVERVYRVTVVPVAGEISHDHAGLKLLVGYDVLVLVRPTSPKLVLSGERHGTKLAIQNTGNVSVELVQGKQCDAKGQNCSSVDGGRIYSGATKTFTINPSRSVEYVARVAEKAIPQKF